MKKVILILILILILAPLRAQQTPVLFSMQSLTGQVNNRSILVQPDRSNANPLWYGTNLVPIYDFTLQPVAGVVVTNLTPWGYTIRVDGWPRSIHIQVPASTNTLNVVSLINTNQFAPLNLYQGFGNSTQPLTNTQTGVTLGGVFSGDGTALALNQNVITNLMTNGATLLGGLVDISSAGIKEISSGGIYDNGGGIVENGGSITATGAGFIGNGASLTGLNASQLTSGTVPLSVENPNVVTNTKSGVTLSGTFSGSLAGNGAGVTNLSPSAISQAGGVTNVFFPPYIPGSITYLAGTQGAINGQQLTSVSDLTLNPIWSFISAGATNPVYLSTAFNGRPAIGFFPNYSYGTAPTVSAALTNNNIFTSGITNNFSVTLVVKDLFNHGGPNDPYTPNGFSPYLLTVGTNGSGNNYLVAWQNDSNFRAGGASSASTPFQRQFNCGYNNAPYVITLRAQNGLLDAWVNGMRVQDTNMYGPRGWIYLDKIITLGNCFQPQSTPVINPSFGAFYGLLGAWMFTTNGVTDEQLYNWHAWALNYFHIAGGTQITLIGDSITQGQYSGANSNLTALLQKAFPSAAIVNEGVPGQTSSTLIGWMTNWSNLQIPTCANVVDVIWWGCNNSSNSTALNSWIIDTTNAIAFSHSLGHRVVLATEPSNNRENSTIFLSRNIRNTWIYTNTTFVPDAVIDQASDPTMGTNGASVAQTSLFHTDNLHVAGPGYVRLSINYWIPTLSKLLYGVGGPIYTSGTNMFYPRLVSGSVVWTNSPQP